tara:strand:+ start:3409 stop:4029 length:621 start_codon:yes stop_codon:yes gene_type:complete
MIDFSALLETGIEFLKTPSGLFTFIPLYAIWVTFLLPGVWASMLAGLLYGVWLGSFLVFLGACLGAELTFILCRYFFSNWAQRLLSSRPKLKVVEKALSQEGWKLILLTRLSPVFPFGLLNFAYGLSQVSQKDFNIGLIGILPGTILFCALGNVAGELLQFKEVLSGQKDITSYIFSVAGGLATIGVIWLATRATRNALHASDLST